MAPFGPLYFLEKESASPAYSSRQPPSADHRRPQLGFLESVVGVTSGVFTTSWPGIEGGALGCFLREVKRTEGSHERKKACQSPAKKARQSDVVPGTALITVL